MGTSFAGEGIGLFLGLLGTYILLCLPIFTVAHSEGHALSWLAFVPIGSLWLLCDLTDKSPAWILVTFLPVGNLIFAVVMGLGLADTLGCNPVLGVLMMFPIIGVIAAFAVVYGQQQSATT